MQVQPVPGDGVVQPPLVPPLVLPPDVPGIQPPFTQVPPPIAANGSGVVQPPDVLVVGRTHPPFTQVQPVPGDGVVQPPLVPPVVPPPPPL